LRRTARHLARRSAAIRKRQWACYLSLGLAALLFAALQFVVLPIVNATIKHNAVAHVLMCAAVGVVAGVAADRLLHLGLPSVVIAIVVLWLVDAGSACRLLDPVFRAQTTFSLGKRTLLVSRDLLAVAVLVSFGLFSAQICAGSSCAPLLGTSAQAGNSSSREQPDPAGVGGAGRVFYAAGSLGGVAPARSARNWRTSRYPCSLGLVATSSSGTKSSR
jgi:hypothetical protein